MSKQITYKQLIEAYEAVAGCDEPDVLITSGRHVKFMNANGSIPVEDLRDIDGNLIHDDMYYGCCRDGIVPVDDNGRRICIA